MRQPGIRWASMGRRGAGRCRAPLPFLARQFQAGQKLGETAPVMRPAGEKTVVVPALQLQTDFTPADLPIFRR